ncbi:uncharacterized protein BDR25DRAFT_348042 [Lindgomyces ingoldianus]|uniref:Uncharacterized protein n=1 Tax=Lindgomyces ingoldianus TaxID=673940 RepID=A0ACB6REE1_9PLEO|nr:uncharacterized protein BDR25DRAFT_348042 [Lindgomyces ingoldianus]KAF2477724.1 hypothetical protein BDR25DRAFT_348042 [Lindgomyces ingoldianus]
MRSEKLPIVRRRIKEGDLALKNISKILHVVANIGARGNGELLLMVDWLRVAVSQQYSANTGRRSMFVIWHNSINSAVRLDVALLLLSSDPKWLWGEVHPTEPHLATSILLSQSWPVFGFDPNTRRLLEAGGVWVVEEILSPTVQNLPATICIYLQRTMPSPSLFNLTFLLLPLLHLTNPWPTSEAKDVIVVPPRIVDLMQAHIADVKRLAAEVYKQAIVRPVMAWYIERKQILQRLLWTNAKCLLRTQRRDDERWIGVLLYSIHQHSLPPFFHTLHTLKVPTPIESPTTQKGSESSPTFKSNATHATQTVTTQSAATDKTSRTDAAAAGHRRDLGIPPPRGLRALDEYVPTGGLILHELTHALWQMLAEDSANKMKSNGHDVEERVGERGLVVYEEKNECGKTAWSVDLNHIELNLLNRSQHKALYSECGSTTYNSKFIPCQSFALSIVS